MERKGDKEDENKRQKQQKETKRHRHDEAFQAGGSADGDRSRGGSAKRWPRSLASALTRCAKLAESRWSTDGSGQTGKTGTPGGNAGVRGEVRALRKNWRRRDEVIRAAKIHRHNFQTVEDKITAMSGGCEQKGLRGKLCQLLEISQAGTTPGCGVGSCETAQSGPAPGTGAPTEKYPYLGAGPSLYHMLKPVLHCSRGREFRLMKAAGIHSPKDMAYKPPLTPATTVIAPNLLQRQFTFNHPNFKPAGDILHPPGKAWLYSPLSRPVQIR